MVEAQTEIQRAHGSISRSADEAFESELRSKLAAYMPTAQEEEQVRQCLADIRALIMTALENPLCWHIAAFGSSVNGCGTRGCDIDIVAYQRGCNPADPWSVLRKLAQEFTKNDKFSVKEHVFGARVPILKLRHAGQRDVDLSINNTNPLPNTRLLKAYASLDARVKELGLLIKCWSKNCGLCGAANGYLSSYSFQLMVIYFLQVADVKLPCLQNSCENSFAADDAPDNLLDSVLVGGWVFQGNIPDLFHGFFKFYGTKFRWGQEVVSVRIGRRLDSDCSEFSELRFRDKKFLHIEDPFDLKRNLSDVLWGSGESDLWEGLKAADHCLGKGRYSEVFSPGNLRPQVRSDWWIGGKNAPGTAGSSFHGSSNNGQGHKLPRTRITDDLVTGCVLEWKGKYGWIKPDEVIEHEKASRNGGRIFVSMSDLSGGAAKFVVGSVCKFHVFSDESGLGAEDCAPL